MKADSTRRLNQRTAHELIEQIGTGGTTARQVTEAVLERIREVDPQINAYLTLDEQGALKKADEVDRKIAGGAPDAMAAECVSFMARGVRTFKPKIGGGPDANADRLRAIREAVGPSVSLRADANQGYSVKEAIRLCRLAEKHDIGLELLEQPVKAWDLQGMAQVRQAVDTLIEADESCFSIHDAMQIVRHEAADVLKDSGCCKNSSYASDGVTSTQSR